jgi:hypothetical protein
MLRQDRQRSIVFDDLEPKVHASIIKGGRNTRSTRGTRKASFLVPLVLLVFLISIFR